MRRSIWLCCSAVLLTTYGLSQEKTQQRPEIDLGPGVKIASLAPWSAPIPPAALARVAEHVGRPVAELERAKLFKGAIRINAGPEEACDMVSVPLSGPAAGGRVVCAVREGGLLATAAWGTLDLDEDPTGRWGAFLIQLQSSWSKDPKERRKVTLASTPARELERRLARAPEDEDARLARALIDLRIVMRRNASLNLVLNARRLPRADWLAELSADMGRAAGLAQQLVPLLGQEGAQEYSRLASDLSATYADYESLLDGLSQADMAEIEPDLAELAQRASANCTSCHRSTGAGRDWPRLFSERRGELGIAETQLQLGYDVAPALGDDGKVSAEIVDKTRAAMLLVEAARK